MKYWIVIILSVIISGCSANQHLSKKEKKAWYLSIEKTACYGDCPIYLMGMNGVGDLSLDAKRFMNISGTYSGLLLTSLLAEIQIESNQLQWENYDKEYLSDYSDLPSTILRFSKSRGDTVTVRFENRSGPKELVNFSSKLDSLRLATKWNSK